MSLRPLAGGDQGKIGQVARLWCDESAAHNQHHGATSGTQQIMEDERRLQGLAHSSTTMYLQSPKSTSERPQVLLNSATHACI